MVPLLYKRQSPEKVMDDQRKEITRDTNCRWLEPATEVQKQS